MNARRPQRNPGLGRRTRITLSSLLLATGVAAAAPPTAGPAAEKLRDDCRIEGEAAGLVGNELDAFVAQCVDDLMAVDLSNLQTD